MQDTDTKCQQHTYINSLQEDTLARLIIDELKKENRPRTVLPAPAQLCDLIF